MKKIKNKTYRTSGRAGETAIIPETMMTISNRHLQYSMNYYAIEPKPGEVTAYIKPTEYTFSLQQREIPLEAANIKANENFSKASTSKVIELKEFLSSNKGWKPNIQLLPALYSIFQENSIDPLKDPSNNTGRTINIYLPDLMDYIGIGRNYSEVQEKTVLRNLILFSTMIGNIIKNASGEYYIERYDLLVIHDYSELTNTICISSPYITKILELLNEGTSRTNGGTQRNNIHTSTNTLSKPNHTRLIKSAMTTARSHYAIEIVNVIIKLIVQAGSKNTPNISAKTIVERCPELRYALDKSISVKKKNALIKRAFSTAWKYLHEYTYLEEQYIDVIIPEVIPTMDTLREKIAFYHKGKKQK